MTRAIVLDIEGTTTPIVFVSECLFPYARARVGKFLEQHQTDPVVLQDLTLLRQQAEEDKGIADAPRIPEEGSLNEPAVRAAVVANVHWQMDLNRKTTGLKSLQGHIWDEGYAAGDLKGEVYEDVPVALQRWKDSGIPVYIYSSGSVHAQKLLFRHSTAGDLTPYLSGHFDTTIGPKVASTSYTAIAKEIGLPVEAMTFITDVLAEAQAARAAGIGRVLLAVRPGNAPVPGDHGFETTCNFVSSFSSS